VQALTDFYDVQSSDFVTYRAKLDEGSIETSVLTRSGWLDIALVLGQGNDQLALDANDTASIGSWTRLPPTRQRPESQTSSPLIHVW
jgi:hypothetical protein